MGQRQSTNNAAEEDQPPAKSDYYDLLGVERTASDDEIKKAYRRKALELHPDRNYGNVDDATRLFAEIQSAYEVLSDPQERAWYDSHRDILLRGGDQAGAAAGGPADEFSYNIRMTTAEDVMKLMMKFNGRLEYTDSPSGFYGGLNDFFKQLANEEDIACQWEGLDSMDYPEFGFAEDDYDDVVRPFYASWNGFATRKGYSWKDEYRLSEAPDRRIRRLMEKENKKRREDAVQEYNEAVRSLVAFVRKRDPRVKNNQQSEAERQRALREATAAQAARSRAARQAQLEQLDAAAAGIPHWAQSRTRDEHEGGFSTESEVEEHEYDCVVCDKTFKSEAQFQAHEKSKKHLKLFKQLQKEMRAEGVRLDLDSDGPQPEPEDVAQEEEVGDRSDRRAAAGAVDAAAEGNAESEADEDEEGSPPSAERMPRTNGTNNQMESASDEHDHDDDENDDYASRSDVEQRLAAGGKPATDAVSAKLGDISLDGTPAPSDLEESGEAATLKLGKAKQKRAKKAAAAAQKKGDENASAPEFQCAVCKAGFPSKTRLFNHIKEKNHAAPLAQTKGTSKAAKGKKR